mmetsp:Transcript_3227/g.11254  ORF Transcript_3227/g.11254 Transcript_3227/m.11254 type:complete len:203 (+) Transcript_3227:1902-2510(+)
MIRVLSSSSVHSPPLPSLSAFWYLTSLESGLYLRAWCQWSLTDSTVRPGNRLPMTCHMPRRYPPNFLCSSISASSSSSVHRLCLTRFPLLLGSVTAPVFRLSPLAPDGPPSLDRALGVDGPEDALRLLAGRASESSPSSNALALDRIAARTSSTLAQRCPWVTTPRLTAPRRPCSSKSDRNSLVALSRPYEKRTCAIVNVAL